MASRPILAPFSVVENGDMSTQIISEVTIIQNISMISYEISWDGSAPEGEITVEVSNSYSKNPDGTVRNEGNWTTLELSNPTMVTGDTDVGFIDIEELAAYAIRVVYTPASGTGVMNIIASGKVA